MFGFAEKHSLERRVFPPCLKCCHSRPTHLEHSWEVLDLYTIITENCSLLSVPHSERRDPPDCSFPVLHHTEDWSPPLTFYHFQLINWVQESHLSWRILRRTRSTTPWSFQSVRQPWLNSNSFVCCRWGYSCKSLLWRVVKLKHSSQGHCHPHWGDINHRPGDGWTLVTCTWNVATFSIYSCCRVLSVVGERFDRDLQSRTAHIWMNEWMNESFRSSFCYCCSFTTYKCLRGFIKKSMTSFINLSMCNKKRGRQTRPRLQGETTGWETPVCHFHQPTDVTGRAEFTV